MQIMTTCPYYTTNNPHMFSIINLLPGIQRIHMQKRYVLNGPNLHVNYYREYCFSHKDFGCLEFTASCLAPIWRRLTFFCFLTFIFFLKCLMVICFIYFFRSQSFITFVFIIKTKFFKRNDYKTSQKIKNKINT